MILFSFLSLVGSYYSKKKSSHELKPARVDKSISEDETSLENHTQFINCQRGAIFKTCDEELNLPNVEALDFCW